MMLDLIATIFIAVFLFGIAAIIDWSIGERK